MTTALRGRSLYLVVAGAAMMLLAAWIASRPLIGYPKPVTGTRLLDLTFALFFAVRGAMYIRTALRRARTQPPAD